MSPEDAVAAVGALADPHRRRLYEFVAEQRDPVSREAAADALHMPVSRAKFHLDRLAAEGLLDVEYRRVSGREGPGAGRPAKLYRRADTEFAVSLPARRYDLMGDILAEAFGRARAGEPLETAVTSAAYSCGRAAIAAVRTGSPAPRSVDAHGQLREAQAQLAKLGYEPDIHGDELRLRNCPFDALAQRHRDLVCASNEHFVQGALDSCGCPEVRAHVEPRPGYCCVVARTSRE